MFRTRLSPRAFTRAAFVVVVGITVSAQAAVILPVARTLSARAEASPVVHAPADVIVGPVYGTFTHAASAQGNNTTASGTVGSTVSAGSLSASVNGSAGGLSGTIRMFSGSARVVIELPEVTEFSVNRFRSGIDGGTSASAQVQRVGGAVVYTESISGFPPPTSLTLQPGQYEVFLGASVTGIQNQTVPMGAGFSMTVVPEPTACAVAGAAALGATLTRRRRRVALQLG
jgi:hypothetical protein